MKVILSFHASKRCLERGVDQEKLIQKIINGDFIKALTQPDKSCICWTVIDENKVYFILHNNKIKTVLHETPAFLRRISSGAEHKRKFKGFHYRTNVRISKMKKQKEIEKDHLNQMREI